MRRYPCGMMMFAFLFASANVFAQEGAIASVPLAATNQWEGAWKNPSDMDGASCRVLAAGSRGTIKIKTWWAEGLRPAPGTAWRVEVEFKDTGRVPIAVDAYAGLPAWRAAHRVGGLADNQWKTAFIPVPWDMIMRMPGTAFTGIALQAPAGTDVPVRAVTVVRGDPRGDEARWGSETRAWVSRVQAEKRGSARQPVPEAPATEPEFSQCKAVPYVRSWLKPIHLNSAPQKSEAGGPLKLRMAMNEIEPGQFGVYAAGGDVLGCTVDIAPDALKDRNGAALKATIELLAAEYAVISGGQLRAQRLWTAYPVDIRKSESHMFLLRIATDEKHSKPGLYSGVIKIRGEAVEAELPVEVEVLPFSLLTMAETDLRTAMCVDTLLPRHELETMVRNNLTGLCLFTYTLPIELKKKSRAEFDIDFAVPDDFMAHAAAAGIRNVVYYLGGDPYGFPDTLSLVRELYRRVDYEGTDLMAARLDLLKKIAASPGQLPPEVRSLYKQWVAKFLDHADKAGWPEIYLSPFDEPAKWSQSGWGACDFYYYRDIKSGQDVVAHVPKRDKEKWDKEQADAGNKPELVCSSGAGDWIKPNFKDQCAAIREAYPKARIYASIHHAEPGRVFLRDVDIYSSDAIHEDREMGTMVKAAGDSGKWFWLYDFSRDAGDPANMRYIFGFFHSAFEARGSLCWAYNWGGQYDSSVGEGPSLFAYTSPYGVITQPHFEGLREAFDDRRYVETLKKAAAAKGKTGQVAEYLKTLGAKSGRNRPGGKWDNVEMLYRETNDPNALDHLRGEVIDWLMQLR